MTQWQTPTEEAIELCKDLISELALYNCKIDEVTVYTSNASGRVKFYLIMHYHNNVKQALKRVGKKSLGLGFLYLISLFIYPNSAINFFSI